MTESRWISAYIAARLNKDESVIVGLLFALPLILENEPPDIFVCMLAALSDDGVRGDLERVVPDYRQKPEFAMVGTAVDSIMQRRNEALRQVTTLQSALD
jgi:hypothetical protein